MTNQVVKRASSHLEPHLRASRDARLSRAREFVAQERPQYRPILSRIPEDELYVDPKISDMELGIVLHEHKSESERQLLAQGRETMVPRKDEETQDYEHRVAEYLRLVDDIKESDLAQYVSYRKVILDLSCLAAFNTVSRVSRTAKQARRRRLLSAGSKVAARSAVANPGASAC